MKIFKNSHLSLYWKCQVIGWSVASLYWGYTGWSAPGFLFSLALLHFVSDLVIYILLTHLYRNVALKNGWHKLQLKDLVKIIVPAVIILGGCFMIITVGKIYLLRLYFNTGFSESFFHFLKYNGLAIFMAGIRLMSIWLLAYHLYHYAQREISITKENARLSLITKDAQLNNLSAQLNPHFFFNSLNNIKALVIENPKSARRAVDLLAELLRTSLYSRDIMLISLADELGLVNDYLELEKLRLEERLQQCLEIEDGVKMHLILRLSMQGLVENAIKHGIDKQKEGGLVKIKAGAKNGFIEISVRNPGTLDPVKMTNGLGLRNLSERIHLQYKGRGKFSIDQQEDGTVLATVLIPIE